MKGSIISEQSGRKTVKTPKENVLELSGKGLQNMRSLPKHYSTCELILDNNSITKIEKLDVFPELSLLSCPFLISSYRFVFTLESNVLDSVLLGEHSLRQSYCVNGSLSMESNRLVRMNGINFAKNLKSVNLSNNSIVSMEGLCWLLHLEYLDLSKNKIKRIQNVSYCTNLKYMDLSENSISEISNLKSLMQLEVLLLHGNGITTLERASEKLPEQIKTLSLSGNGISDLNEVHYLSCLLNLKHFSIMNNPCVITALSLPFESVFNFRPFILSCLSSLLMIDGSAITASEREEGEMLKSDRNLKLFTFGNHLQLVLYLSKICSVPGISKISKDQSDFLEKFLRERQREIGGDQKDGFSLDNVYNSEEGNVKANDSVQSSCCSVLNFSQITRNASGNFSLDEESDTDTLRSDSRFLPVLSPLKKSPGNNRQFQSSLSWDTLPPSDAGDVSIMSDGLTNKSEDLPIMSEDEANKLINLAATIMQSHIRGFLARRKFDYRNFKRMHAAASKIQALWRGYYFRQYNNESLNFRNELRVKRLQKYISTLCLIMQKSEKQHETERKQMLEITTLLYKKFTQLSQKVKELESSSNKSIEIERNVDELEDTLHPVFFPHPRLLRNVEEKEDVRITDNISSNERQYPVAEDIGWDFDLKNVVGSSKDVEVDRVILGPPRQGIMEKQCTLMDQEDPESYKKVQEVEIGKVNEYEILDQEDDPRWHRESGNSGHSTDNSEDVGTNEDSYIHKTPEVSGDELSTDIAQNGSKNEAMSGNISVVFTTANVCELLRTIESDKELGVDDEATEDIITENESPLENDVPNNEGGILEDCSRVVHQKPISHHVSADEGTEHVEVITTNMDDEIILSASEDVQTHEKGVSFEESPVESENDSVNKDNTSEVWYSGVNVKDNMIETSGHSDISLDEDTGIKLDEETEFSHREVKEKPTKTPHAHTDKGLDDDKELDDCILKESSDKAKPILNNGDTIVDITGDPEEVTKSHSVVANVESNVANVESNVANVESKNEARNESQQNEVDVTTSDVMENAIKESIEDNKEVAMGNLEQEVVTETTATEATRISPKLGERASSLLFALKDEISGVTSKETECDQRRNSSTSEHQEITNVDEDDFDKVLQQT